jgi:hypothetical protein
MVNLQLTVFKLPAHSGAELAQWREWLRAEQASSAGGSS